MPLTCLRVARTSKALRLGASFLLALLGSLITLPAAAQPCPSPGPDSIAFTGHSLPLDGPLITPQLATELAFPNLGNFTQPVFLTSAEDGSGRLFVVEQGGSIWSFPNTDAAEPSDRQLFFDLSDQISAGGEGGLIGLAFDPEFSVNGSFYVYYTAEETGGPCGQPLCFRSIIERFTADPPETSSVNPNTAARQRLVEVWQPYRNHNGGMLAFGPDGYLHIALGDGGSANDPEQNGQDLTTPLGALLRIDPTDGQAAPDNPFAGTVGNPNNPDPRILHYGLRNPWRFSFDREFPNDLWIGDVGQSSWEEIDRARADARGLNFGWRNCEGNHDSDVGTCPFDEVEAPVLELPRRGTISGQSITGGYVYRGAAVPSLRGTYVFGDFVNGNLYAWDGVAVDPETGLGEVSLLASIGNVASFGEDATGELYVLDYSGAIYRLRPDESVPETRFPDALSETGLFANTAALTPTEGLIEYDVGSPLWSDRATKQRWLALPAGESIELKAEGALEFPVGTVFVKQFNLPIGPGVTRRLETRLFLHQAPGWTGVTYRWNEDESDALLLYGAAADTFDVEIEGVTQEQTWRYPSPTECLACHTAAAGRVLGFRAPQLNHDFDYPSGVNNQLNALGCAGVFQVPVPSPEQFPSWDAIDGTRASRQARVRAHLDVNCAPCHQPLGPAPGSLDLRATPLLGDLDLIDVPASQGDLGLLSPDRIRAGDATQSVLWERMRTLNPVHRMAPGTLVPDEVAIAVVGEWINEGLLDLDSDEDGQADAVDNCPAVANTNQAESDGDALGDACDPDAAADLFVELDGNPATVFEDTAVSLTGLVWNQGLTDAPPTGLRFYLSTDLQLDPALDPRVGFCQTDEVIPGTRSPCTDREARIPADLFPPDGEPERLFHWAACADQYDLIFEGNEENNCTVSTETVRIPEPTIALNALAALMTLASLRWIRRRRLARVSNR